MAKQDIVAVRTAAELEQKYGWGKRFAEVMGIATDARTVADGAADAVIQLSEDLNSEEIFNRLTNNSNNQGIYRQDGKIYINASYIKTGEFAADLIKAGVLQSKDGSTFYLDLDNGILRANFEEFSVGSKTVDEIAKGKAESAVNEYAEIVKSQLDALQSQIDGQIQTWFYDYEPTAGNYPASEWTTEEEKNNHLGDLFYVVDNEESSGMVYRWSLINGVYKWEIVTDTEVAKALALAAEAKSTADGKSTVFLVTPVPPYDEGDLWAQGSDGELMRCVNTRTTGEFNKDDWELATKYVDSVKAGAIAQEKINGLSQRDIYNKLTNYSNNHGVYLYNDKLYINASYINTGELNADILTSGILKSKDGTTFYLDLTQGILRGKFKELSIGGETVDSKISRSETSTKNYADAQANNAKTSAYGYADDRATSAEKNANLYSDAAASKAEKNAKSYADKAAEAAVALQSAMDIFNKLTEDQTIQGMFIDEGKVYINAEFIKSGILMANLIQSGILKSKDNETFYLDLDNGVLKMKAQQFTLSGKTVDKIAEDAATTAASTAEGNAKYYADNAAKSAASTAEGNAKSYADTAAQNAVNSQSQEDIFNKLTNYSADQGIFLENGKVYINAEMIQSLEKLFAKDIIMTGKFECQAETYLPPTYDDCIYMLRHLFFPDDYPLPTGRNFDFNRDGKVDESDVFLMQKVVEGLYPVTSLGVSKTTATLTINMSDPSKLICISGYNMWGTKVEAAIGVDPYTCTYETKDYVRRMMRQDTNSTTLYRIVDGEQEYINPPMSFMAVYRTAERIMSKPVYTVLMIDGQIPTGYQVVRKSEAFTMDGKTLRQYWLIKNS